MGSPQEVSGFNSTVSTMAPLYDSFTFSLLLTVSHAQAMPFTLIFEPSLFPFIILSAYHWGFITGIGLRFSVRAERERWVQNIA